jgi:hypothetical protein
VLLLKEVYGGGEEEKDRRKPVQEGQHKDNPHNISNSK